MGSLIAALPARRAGNWWEILARRVALRTVLLVMSLAQDVMLGILLRRESAVSAIVTAENVERARRIVLPVERDLRFT